jgi:hypothetical protein
MGSATARSHFSRIVAVIVRVWQNRSGYSRHAKDEKVGGETLQALGKGQTHPPHAGFPASAGSQKHQVEAPGQSGQTCRPRTRDSSAALPAVRVVETGCLLPLPSRRKGKETAASGLADRSLFFRAFLVGQHRPDLLARYRSTHLDELNRGVELLRRPVLQDGQADQHLFRIVPRTAVDKQIERTVDRQLRGRGGVGATVRRLRVNPSAQ